MKKRAKIIFFTAFIYILTFSISVQAQSCQVNELKHGLFLNFKGDTPEMKRISLSFFPSTCITGIRFEEAPHWVKTLRVLSGGRVIEVECEINSGAAPRETRIFCNSPDNRPLGVIEIKQEVGCYKNWYPDSDGDGFGDPGITPMISCNKPIGFVDNNDDNCPDEFSEINNGCPLGVVYENRNWIAVENKDITGKVIAKNKTYFDVLGKVEQEQSVDIKTGKTWASQTLYDSYGRTAIQTLSAPTNGDITTDFLFREDFVKNSDNNTFTIADYEGENIEAPSTVGIESNSLGWYYSTNNTTELYQDETTRPYSRSIYSKLNPRVILKNIGGNQVNREWKNSYTFSMPAGQELSKDVAFNDAKYNNYKVIKTITRDVHGIENVVFTDTDGNTLATARSGNEERNTVDTRYSTILFNDAQNYIDIHIPVGEKGITVENDFGSVVTNNSNFFKVYNLLTEEKTSVAFENLSSGFYRIMKMKIEEYYHITYPENYYDYSLNEYDKAGHLVASYQPLKDADQNKLKSEFRYNSLGQLEYSKSPDEGEAWFLYRKDGQIRFSVNSEQLEKKKFSYTNYDELGRPEESGVYWDNTNFFTRAPNTINGPFKQPILDLVDELDGLPNAHSLEKTISVYGERDNEGIIAAFGSDPRKTFYTNQNFIAGNVSKTYTQGSLVVNDNYTWYSYDIYGRVQWIVQKIQDLDGAKTIDYEYDDITGQVNKVYYQKHHPTEQFIHRYTYDADDYSLLKVETSKTDNDVDFKNNEHAYYQYYETGALKRINLARDKRGQPLQGIDYVYNLNGALKSINHPDLKDTSDPGNDANDIFGMSLHYYNGDYLRNSPKPISNTSNGINQYNGNIKAITTNTKTTSSVAESNTYVYKYNRNNWLTNARYNYQGNFDESYNATESFTTVIPTNTTEKQKATEMIRWMPGFKATEGSYVNARIVPEGTSDGDYDVSGISYDANGNIQSLYRNKNEENGSNAMDQLAYTYKADKPNQLVRVDDAVIEETNANDIKDQVGSNYVYNEIGQLIEDHKYVTTEKPNNIVRYEYNASGLVNQITKNNLPVVKFFYNDRGHRVRKESYTPETGVLNYTEHYVRDPSGIAMAIYRDGQVIENTIYGTGRLGVRKPDDSHLYQLTDHLGNVRAVVGRTSTGQAMALTNATDYYPFGMPMPGRQIVNGEPYRYAYQGQEKDSEIDKEAFELRLWDSRTGRWLTTDPYRQFASPYLGMGNNPTSVIDPDGGRACIDADGNPFPCPQGYEEYNEGSIDAFFDNEQNFTGFIDRLEPVFLNVNNTQATEQVSSIWPALFSSLATVFDDRASKILRNREKYTFIRGDLSSRPLQPHVNVRLGLLGSYEVSGRTIQNFGYAARAASYGFGMYNAYSLYNDRSSLSSVEYYSEQGTNLFSTIGGLYGLSWSIGWESGKKHGHILHNIPGYTRFKNNFRKLIGLPPQIVSE